MAEDRPDGRIRRLGDAFRWLPPSEEIREVRRERRAMLRRALRGACPLCGSRGIRSGWWSIRDRCPTCNFAFRRERGYLIGAAWLNLTATLAVLGAVILGWTVLTVPDTPWPLVGIASAVTVVVVPILLQPFAVALWLWVDLAYFRPLDADDLAANDPPESGPADADR